MGLYGTGTGFGGWSDIVPTDMTPAGEVFIDSLSPAAGLQTSFYYHASGGTKAAALYGWDGREFVSIILAFS